MTRSGERARRALENDAADVDRDDLDRALSKREIIERKVRNSPRLSGYLERIQTLYALIQDYIAGHYRDIPWGSIASIVAALLYVLNPLDMIPDFIPGFGFVDDATVVGLCLKLIARDLGKYEEWRQNRGATRRD